MIMSLILSNAGAPTELAILLWLTGPRCCEYPLTEPLVYWYNLHTPML